MLVLLWFTGCLLLLCIWSIWKHVRSAFTTPQRPVDSAPSVANQNTNIISPSMVVEETQHPTGSDSSEGEDPVLEAIPDSLDAVRPEVPSTSLEAGSQSDSVDDEESNSSSDLDSDDDSDPNYYCIEDYKCKWVCQSAKETEKKFNYISRASLFPKSPFPRSLRPAKQKRLSRFLSNGRTQVEALLYHPLLPTLPVQRWAFRWS